MKQLSAYPPHTAKAPKLTMRYWNEDDEYDRYGYGEPVGKPRKRSKRNYVNPDELNFAIADENSERVFASMAVSMLSRYIKYTTVMDAHYETVGNRKILLLADLAIKIDELELYVNIAFKRCDIVVHECFHSHSDTNEVLNEVFGEQFKRNISYQEFNKMIINIDKYLHGEVI